MARLSFKCLQGGQDPFGAYISVRDYRDLRHRITCDTKPCRAPAVRGYNVCRVHGVHGGAPKGNRNALKHGHYTAEAIARRRDVAALLRSARAAVEELHRRAAVGAEQRACSSLGVADEFVRLPPSRTVTWRTPLHVRNRRISGYRARAKRRSGERRQPRQPRGRKAQQERLEVAIGAEQNRHADQDHERAEGNLRDMIGGLDRAAPTAQRLAG